MWTGIFIAVWHTVSVFVKVVIGLWAYIKTIAYSVLVLVVGGASTCCVNISDAGCACFTSGTDVDHRVGVIAILVVVNEASWLSGTGLN